MNQTFWDMRFVEAAKFFSTWSKDPSTKCGAVIVDNYRRIISTGYNGFARGVDDRPDRYQDRDLKLKMIVHCERNALLFATQPLHGCTLYVWPFLPCAPCAAMVIQAGITRCVAPETPEHMTRWAADIAIGRGMFEEAGVSVTCLRM